MKIEIFYSISIFKYTSWILVVKIISLWVELETKKGKFRKLLVVEI